MKYRLFYLFSLLSLFFVTPAVAASPKLPIQDNGYAAKFVSQSITDPITIEAGSAKTVILKFKNVGTATWNEKGKNFVSAYTVEPKYRQSVFRGTSWIGNEQTAKIKGVVKPGGIGELVVDLKAPTQAGEYTEQFFLSSEDHTWIQGGYFFLKIKVAPAKPAKSPEGDRGPGPESSSVKKEEAVVPVSAAKYRAKFLGFSKPQVILSPEEKIDMIFIYQNIGENPWKSFSFKGNEGAALAGITVSFADDTWKNLTLVRAGTINTPKDGLLQKNFTLKAPVQPGKYQASFYLEIEGEKVAGSEAVVDVTVTSNAPEHINSETAPPATAIPAGSPRLAVEPIIRVGLKQITEEIIFTSDEGEYDVWNGNSSTPVARLPAGSMATVNYKTGSYSCLCNGVLLTSVDFFRFTPVNNPHARFELQNFERNVTWQKGVNFNKYRGTFELRFPKKGESPYAINELLFEDYVAGIREVSNGTPMEYMKSQAVLQRTYAYYIKEQSNKHADRFFDVVAHTGDQLYLGYQSEQLMPRFVEAVAATRGLMVVYDKDQNSATLSEVVITPYFGNSDGRTRSWKEVWGGKDDKPWLVSVPAVYDKRDKKKMYGHGVGMSQRDAIVKADKEKVDYVTLVKYYYTGVEIEKIY